MAHPLDDTTMVDGQIAPADVAALAGQGVTMIVNNRPDDEDEGQPASDDIEAAATAAGIAYRHIPIVRGLGPADVEAMRKAIAAVAQVEGGKMFAFCRTGNRSALAWAVARSEDGVKRAEIERSVEGAGYDVGPVAHLLRD